MSEEAAQHRIVGSLHRSAGVGVVRMNARLDSGADDVWAALTDPGRLVQWLGEIDGDLRPNGEFRACFSATGWEGTGVIEECRPPNRLRVRTKDTDGSNEGPVELTLTSEGDHTTLVWQEQVPADLLAEYGAGIQIHIEDLAAHIEGRARSNAQARWDELIPDYRNLETDVHD